MPKRRRAIPLSIVGDDLKKLSEEHGANRERQIFALVNARLDPDWGEERRTSLTFPSALAMELGAIWW